MRKAKHGLIIHPRNPRTHCRAHLQQINLPSNTIQQEDSRRTKMASLTRAAEVQSTDDVEHGEKIQKAFETLWSESMWDPTMDWCGYVQEKGRNKLENYCYCFSMARNLNSFSEDKCCDFVSTTVCCDFSVLKHQCGCLTLTPRAYEYVPISNALIPLPY